MESKVAGRVASIAVEPDGPDVVLRLPEAVGTELAMPLYGAAVQSLLGGGRVVVDCAGTRHIGAAGLQILISLARELDRSGRGLELAAVGPELAASLAQVGATALLERRG